jgi:AAA domain
MRDDFAEAEALPSPAEMADDDPAAPWNDPNNPVAGMKSATNRRLSWEASQRRKAEFSVIEGGQDDDEPPDDGYEPPSQRPADRATETDDSAPQQTKQAKQRFQLVAFDQVKVDTTRRGYLIKGLLASTGLAVVWGPPKCGKSFWAMDVGLHISLGWEYRGRRVQQVPIVYVALEGQHGFPARVEGFRCQHKVDAAPFFLVMTRLNLIAEARALVAAIKAQIGDVLPGAVFIVPAAAVSARTGTRRM